jgi:hypothetical protein
LSEFLSRVRIFYRNKGVRFNGRDKLRKMIGQSVVGRSGQRFTVLREIGRGSFGIVYLVEDEARKHAR